MNIKPQFHQKYKILSKNGIPCNLGFGSYGSVQLANNIQTNELVAIKKIFNKISAKEVQIHSKLNHFNVIRLIQAFFDYQKKCTILILEYANNGSLFDFLASSNFKDQTLIFNVFKGICKGLDYLHRNSVIHRDIKAQNILLDQDYNPKICDFGSAFDGQSSDQNCGTQLYMAPQIFLHQEYNRKADVWSLGVLLYQMVEGKLPFNYISKLNFFEQIKKPLKFTQKSGYNFKELILQMLIISPQSRPQINQILTQKICKIEKSITLKDKIAYQRTRISTTSQHTDKQQQNWLYMKNSNNAVKSMQVCRYKKQKQNVISIKQYKQIKKALNLPKIDCQTKIEQTSKQCKDIGTIFLSSKYLNNGRKQEPCKISLKRRHQHYLIQ